MAHWREAYPRNTGPTRRDNFLETDLQIEGVGDVLIPLPALDIQTNLSTSNYISIQTGRTDLFNKRLVDVHVQCQMDAITANGTSTVLQTANPVVPANLFPDATVQKFSYVHDGINGYVANLTVQILATGQLNVSFPSGPAAAAHRHFFQCTFRYTKNI